VVLAWVLGAKGFVGQHLSRHLSHQGDTVLGLGHGPWQVEMAIREGVSFWIDGEIDEANLFKLLERSGPPDVIYQLAGGSSVAVSMQFPNEDFERTVTSTAVLLEWVRNFSPESKIVAVSSAAVYGDSGSPALAEAGNYIPFSPYGFHKRMLELMCESYARNYGLNVTIVRLFSIYGNGLKKQLLWDICTRLVAQPSVLEMQGSGKELRDWLHVSDAVKILQAAAQRSASQFMIVNGGSGIGTSVASVVELVCSAWGAAPTISFSGQRRSGDPVDLVADTSLLFDLLGQHPHEQLTHGVREYVRWYKEMLR
jgi:UDP-glucose 4-epimerase